MNEKKQPLDGVKQGIIFDKIDHIFDGLSLVRELQCDNKEFIRKLFGGSFPSELETGEEKSGLPELKNNSISITHELEKINNKIDAIIEREKEIKECLINYIG